MFDTENSAAWSAAARAVDEARPALEAKIAEVRNQATAEASQRTKADLFRIVIDQGARVSSTAAKDVLVAAVADHAAKAIDAYTELEALKTDAMFDRLCASQLNNALEAAEAIHAKVRERMDACVDMAPRRVAYDYVSDTDQMLCGQYLAQLAFSVSRLMEDKGLEFRAAVAEVTRECVTETLRFAHRILSNGTGNARRLEDVAKAYAASEFTTRIAHYVLGETVPTAWLNG